MSVKIAAGPQPAGKGRAAAGTQDHAARELFSHLEAERKETLFDRHAAQQPQCKFGLGSACCSMCFWGPCRVAAGKKGVCGRDAGAVAAANALRGLGAGLACQLAHAREVVLTALAAAEGRCEIRLTGEARILDLARRLNLEIEGKTTERLAEEIALELLDGLGKLTEWPLPLLQAYAPAERIETWERLGLLPRSASLEVVEALHRTSLGGCSDSGALVDEALRASLAYLYSALFASSVSTEMLYGIPEPRATEVNFGVLKRDHVNVLVHGHSPVMVEKVLEKLRSRKIRQLARKAGAKGIVVGGMCCTGHSLLAEYGVPTVTNVLGQELALGTGAVDAVVVDMQCVLPGLKIVADCVGTEIITTCSSNRIPGATHIPFDPEKPGTLDRDADLVARKAVEGFAKRDRSKAFIPGAVSQALTGWSYEAIIAASGGVEPLLERLKDGSIRGIATIVGCSSPKAPYGLRPVAIARSLLERGILVTTTGCAAHTLLNAGLCTREAAHLADTHLRQACEELAIPPVLAVGGCIDNVRTLRLFTDLAEAAGASVSELPFALACPEPGNEKATGIGLAFTCHGVPAVIGLHVPGKAGEPVELFEEYGLREKVGAALYAAADPQATAALIADLVESRREALVWSPAKR